MIAYDHRGHGRSPVPEGPYSIADLAGDVLALLDSLSIERASHCGISLGAMVGIWLGEYAPWRIDRLVVACSSAHMPPRSDWEQRAQTVRAARSVEPLADGGLLERWVSPQFAAEHPQQFAWLREMLISSPVEGYASCAQAIGELDLRGALGEITAPTLVIAGEDDPSTPPETHAAPLASAIIGARLAVVPGARHLANVEQPELVTRLILEHLSDGANGAR